MVYAVVSKTTGPQARVSSTLTHGTNIVETTIIIRRQINMRPVTCHATDRIRV